MVRPRGLEPLTYGLEGRCSIQLSYERINTILQRLNHNQKPKFHGEKSLSLFKFKAKIKSALKIQPFCANFTLNSKHLRLKSPNLSTLRAKNLDKVWCAR